MDKKDPDAANEGHEDAVAHLQALQAHHASAKQAGDTKSASYFKSEIESHIAKHTAANKQMKMLRDGMGKGGATAPLPMKAPAITGQQSPMPHAKAPTTAKIPSPKL